MKVSQLAKVSEQKNDIATLLQSPSMIAQIKMALPKHVTPERMARIVLTQLRQVPALLNCTRESLLGCVMQAAQLGLEPGTLGHCWLIPYGRECTLIVGYRGMAQLAWRSSQIASIAARAVFEGDVFAYDYGADRIEHKPGKVTDPAKLTHAYAIIHTTNGGRLWDVMTRDEIDKIRSRSRAGKSGPWMTDYAEMSKKTVLRRIFKIAPCSVELQAAMALDESADQGIPQGIDFEIPAEMNVTPAKAEGAEEPSGQSGDPDLPTLLGAAIELRSKKSSTPIAFKKRLRAELGTAFGDLSALEGEELDRAVEAAGKIEVNLVEPKS